MFTPAISDYPQHTFALWLSHTIKSNVKTPVFFCSCKHYLILPYLILWRASISPCPSDPTVFLCVCVLFCFPQIAHLCLNYLPLTGSCCYCHYVCARHTCTTACVYKHTPHISLVCFFLLLDVGAAVSRTRTVIKERRRRHERMYKEGCAWMGVCLCDALCECMDIDGCPREKLSIFKHLHCLTRIFFFPKEIQCYTSALAVLYLTNHRLKYLILGCL